MSAVAVESDRRGRFLARRDAERRQLEEAGRIPDRALLAAIRAKQTPSALLLGPTGVGKTGAALWLLAGTRHRLVTSAELSQAEREHPLGQGPPPAVLEARQASRLIVDDVGFERDVFALQDLLNYRYHRDLSTIVTSGLTRSELRQLLGAPYVRRIVEQHAGFPLLLADCHEGEFR